MTATLALAPTSRFDDLITRHPQHLALRCALCRAEPGQPCHGSNGVIVAETHMARRAETRNRLNREPYLALLTRDDPPGLHAGDTLLVQQNKDTQTVTVLERMDDGATPGCSVHVAAIEFLSFC